MKLDPGFLDVRLEGQGTWSAFGLDGKLKQKSGLLVPSRRRLLMGAAMLACAPALGGLVAPMPLTSNVPATFETGRGEDIGFGTGAGTTVTASATVGTKGSATTLGTSSFAYDYFQLWTTKGTALVRGILDILATPPGGSAQLVAANIVIDHDVTVGPGGGAAADCCEIWAKIPAGSKISAQWASNTANATVAVAINGWQGGAGQYKLPANYSRMVSVGDFITSTPYVDPVCYLPSRAPSSGTMSTPVSLNPTGYVNCPRLSGVAVMGTGAGVAWTSTGQSIFLGYGPNSGAVTNFIRFYCNNPITGKYLGPVAFDLPEGLQYWLSMGGEYGAAATGWTFGLEGVAA
jgi:hypothetical protein